MNKIKVLFLSANPKDTSLLKLDEEIRMITQKIRASEYRDSLELVSAWAIRADDLLQTLNEHKPHIVHFSGHGNSKGEIILLDNTGISKPISQQAITALFKTLKDNIRLVILNACYSRSQAEAIREIVDCTIGMNTTISDPAAIIFIASFYRAIGFGRSIGEAFDQGITALLLEGISEDRTPMLFARDENSPETIFLIKPDPNEEHNGTKRTRNQLVIEGESVGLTETSDEDVKRLPRLPNNARYIERFAIERFIGRGGFADVYLAWDESSNNEHKVALKLYQYEGQPKYIQRYINREAIISQLFSSKNIPGLVRTYETKWLPNKAGLFIVQEYIVGRSLHDRIDTKMFLDLKESVLIAIGLCETLFNLHKQNIAHCDVKPLNILISSAGKPVLIDVGAARYFDEAMSKDEIVVSIPYSSRYLLSGEPVNAQVDIFSLAMTLLHMLVGFPDWIKARHSYELNTTALRPKILSTLPDQEEILGHFYNCLFHINSKLLRESLTKAINEQYENIDQFRTDLLAILS